MATWLLGLGLVLSSGEPTTAPARQTESRGGDALRAQPVAPGFFVVEQRFELGQHARGLEPEDFAASAKQRVERAPAGLRFQPIGVEPEAQAWIEFPPLATAPFRDVVASWNARVPDGAGMRFELRVGRDAAEWGPWLHVGSWGETLPGERELRCPGGKIDIDYFVGTESFTRVQLRARAGRREPSSSEPIELESFSLCVTDRFVEHSGHSSAWERRGAKSAPGVDAGGVREARELPTAGARIELAVPFRSQKTEDPSIAGRICSPTSLAMVLAYRGIDVSTGEVARLCYDIEHDLYGNWTRAIQAAFTLGVPGYLTRISEWERVRELLEAGSPLVISIAAKEGQLRGAPYASTGGHLLVLRGFDEHGDVLVNDPAASEPEKGKLVYHRADLEICWMARGGTAYVLLPMKATSSSGGK